MRCCRSRASAVTSPGRFSFNVKGGRCEACEGDGMKRIEMNFLPDVYVLCDVCRGARYNRETLSVKYKGQIDRRVAGYDCRRSAAVAGEHSADSNRSCKRCWMSVLAISSWANQPRHFPAAKRNASSWPRNCPNARLAARFIFWTSQPPAFTLPTCTNCWTCCSVWSPWATRCIVIEHNLDVIKCADYIIDLGPEGGAHGGRVVAAGTPEEVARSRRSHTGQVLRPLLNGKLARTGNGRREDKKIA